jgi:hypothetical protein
MCECNGKVDASTERMTRGQALDWMIEHPGQQLIGSDGHTYWMSNNRAIRKRLGEGEFCVNMAALVGVHWTTATKRKPPELAPGWLWELDHNGNPLRVVSPVGLRWDVYRDQGVANLVFSRLADANLAHKYLNEELATRGS